MGQYLKLTIDIKSALWYSYFLSFLSQILRYLCFSDADFKLAPFFDGYDRNRLSEHDRELQVDYSCL